MVELVIALWFITFFALLLAPKERPVGDVLPPRPPRDDS